MTRNLILFGVLLSLAMVGCGDDGGGTDAGADGGELPVDAGRDSGTPPDGGMDDGGGTDDGGPGDGGVDDGGIEDGGIEDGGPGDAGTPCTMDLDCSDGMDCSGVETCVAGVCVPGTPVDADSDTYSCDDCDDTDAAIHPGATEICNSADDNCNGATDESLPTMFYADCDADMWAEIGATTSSGCAPTGDTGCLTASPAWTARVPTDGDYDCGDEDERAHSGVTMFFTTPIMETDFLEFPFDFDCDGAEEPQFPAAGSCSIVGGSCTTTAGWLGTVPACGDSGLFITACATGCLPTTETRTQGCQ